MNHVPDYQEFLGLVKRIEDMEREMSFWKELLSNVRWLSRAQTIEAIGCSEATLWKLTKAGNLTFEKQGRRIRYDADSIRQYLRSKKIESWAADKRVLTAAHSIQ